MRICSRQAAFVTALLLCASLTSAQTASPPSAGGVMVGQTEPAATVEVSSAVRGILAEVLVREGQVVKEGDLLMRLDDELQKQKVEYERVSAEATAEIQYARNQVDFAMEAHKRIKDIGTVTEVQEKVLAIKQAEVSAEAAKDKQAQAKSRYNQERIILEHMRIKSPISGSVLRLKKRAGEQTDEGPVAVVVQTSKLNAIFYPGKEMFGKVKVGDRVPLDFEGVKREGTVVAVDPVMDPVSQRFRVKFEVENEKGDLAGGVGAKWVAGK